MDLEGVEVVARETWGRTVLRGYCPARRGFVEVIEVDCLGVEQGEAYQAEMRKLRGLVDNEVLGETLEAEYNLERRLFRIAVPSPAMTLASFISLRQRLEEEQLASLLRHLVSGLDKCSKAVIPTQHFPLREVSPHSIALSPSGKFQFYRYLPYYPATVSAYHAPLLNYYIRSRTIANSSFEPLHTPSKSAIFALGMVMLELMWADQAEHPEGPEGIKNSDWAGWLKQALMWMLKPDESDRCDPSDLLLYLQTTRLVLPRLPRSRTSPKQLIRLSPGQEAESPHIQLLCISCMHTYMRSQDLPGLGSETIALGCAEGTHILCDLECVMRYVEKGGCQVDLTAGMCPFCTSPFPQSVVEAYGTRVKERWVLTGRGVGTLGKEEGVRCVYCGMEGKWGVPLHAGDSHWVCSETCLKAYALLDCPQNQSDLPCPFPGCSLLVSTQLILQAFGSLKALKQAWKEIDQHRSTAKFPAFPAIFTGPKVRCCHCRLILSLNSVIHQAEAEKPLFLTCQTPGHMFCSKECMRDYVEQQTRNFEMELTEVTCPICRVRIEQDIIIQAYNGPELLDIRKRSFQPSQSCLKCARSKGKIKLQCGHRYCHRCVRQWYKVKSSEKEAQIKCPACHKPMNCEDFRKVKSKIEKVGEFFSSFWGG